MEQKTMNQNIWGPHAWRVLHTVFSIPHPKLDIISDLTCHILPCGICVMHCHENIRKVDHERNLALKWFKIHNLVNIRTNKPVWSESRFRSTRFPVDAQFFTSFRILLLMIAKFYENNHPYSKFLDTWVKLVLEVIGSPPEMYFRFIQDSSLVNRINRMFNMDRVTELEKKIVQSAVIVRHGGAPKYYFSP